MRIRNAVSSAAAAAAALVALAGCAGSAGPTAFGPGERSVSVARGDTFTLEVPASPALGQNWYLASPRPDRSVVTYQGRREELEGSDEELAGGGDGTQFFDFRAHTAGRTTVKLLFCPYGRCHSAAETTLEPPPTSTVSPKPVPTATGTPQDSDQEPAYYLYTITVR